MGILPAWAFLTWRLGEEAEKYNVSTFTEYLEVKHGKSGKTLRTISSLPLAVSLQLRSSFPIQFTADLLLILSAAELSESILRKRGKSEEESLHAVTLRKHRFTTALVAISALALSYVFPAKLIFTIVSYVWAGIGTLFQW